MHEPLRQPEQGPGRPGPERRLAGGRRIRRGVQRVESDGEKPTRRDEHDERKRLRKPDALARPVRNPSGGARLPDGSGGRREQHVHDDHQSRRRPTDLRTGPGYGWELPRLGSGGVAVRPERPALKPIPTHPRDGQRELLRHPRARGDVHAHRGCRRSPFPSGAGHPADDEPPRRHACGRATRALPDEGRLRHEGLEQPHGVAQPDSEPGQHIARPEPGESAEPAASDRRDARQRGRYPLGRGDRPLPAVAPGEGAGICDDRRLPDDEQPGVQFEPRVVHGAGESDAPHARREGVDQHDGNVLAQRRPTVHRRRGRVVSRDDDDGPGLEHLRVPELHLHGRVPPRLRAHHLAGASGPHRGGHPGLLARRDRPARHDGNPPDPDDHRQVRERDRECESDGARGQVLCRERNVRQVPSLRRGENGPDLQRERHEGPERPRVPGQLHVALHVEPGGRSVQYLDDVQLHGQRDVYGELTLFVDDQLPTARFKTNRTVGDSTTGVKLLVDEGIPIKFDGGPSTDVAYPGKNGTILDGGYSWDFNGDHIADATGRTVTHTFTKPGNFTVNLTVTDSVGWKSANASMTALVNDTKAPLPAFDILDSSKDWGTITSPMERKTYSFNASRTTDDHDKYNYSGGTGLNVTWTIPGPIVGMTGTNHTFYGINVTFAWQEWNSSYTVRLAVKDTGFGSNKPNTGYLNRSVQVQIDVTLHADLKVEAGTLKLNPADPEESAQMTVTVNVTNKAGRAAAGNVATQVLAISGGVTTVVATQADWFDKTGNPKGSHSIASPETVTLVFHLSLSGQGNKTLQVYVYDSSEPYTWITSENRASLPVNVRQPAWQPYAIYGSVIGIIALFVFGMYARRKIKAGEWRPLRGRRQKGGEEKEKPRREIKEEKKRL
ncbi:MAG: PKD domain-containing protein [Methanobacteriota archaeon]|nr:MAG: PKD domain-containing protein [Euryarchaeota archaeon]